MMPRPPASDTAPNQTEDAALVRRVGKGYLLRHEGLYLLFRGRPERQARERVVKKSDPMDLD